MLPYIRHRIIPLTVLSSAMSTSRSTGARRALSRVRSGVAGGKCCLGSRRTRRNWAVSFMARAFGVPVLAIPSVGGAAADVWKSSACWDDDSPASLVEALKIATGVFVLFVL